ncbi:type II CRISPR-associated endonuclease Cas1 [Planctomicrobium sp. SH527]|uniref:type II CRISPR-associated endonuclease Cas1 n=1 Tax=Planctomicrobium sp. SH527 TaxID=3448123 RepID=UPI003F5BFC9B
MIKRTIEISQEPAHLSAKQRQLLLKREGSVIASFPSEDLGVVVVEHPQTTYTHSALVELAEQDAVLVICGRNHLPCGMLLPVGEHTEVVSRLRLQIAMTAPTKKRVWQQIVRAKILAQAENLTPDSPTERRLKQLAARVRSGDPDNREALAARFYWSAWLMESPQAAEERHPFRRDPDGNGINAMLNYGYAILRAALARSIVSAGLNPALGVQHSNRSNAFCLADDLIEPVRPIVDQLVRNLVFSGESEITPAVKAELLGLLTKEVRTGDVTGPLSIALQRYVVSFVSIMDKDAKQLSVPVRCKSATIAACG